jgi:hypothetical protein
LKRHLDILLFLAGAMFSAGMLYNQNNNAISDAQADIASMKPKIESINDVKTDVAVIKQQVGDTKEKVDMIWNYIQSHD